MFMRFYAIYRLNKLAAHRAYVKWMEKPVKHFPQPKAMDFDRFCASIERAIPSYRYSGREGL